MMIFKQKKTNLKQKKEVKDAKRQRRLRQKKDDFETK